MQVRIVQAGDDPPALQIDDFRVWTGFARFPIVHAHDAVVLDGDRSRLRVFRVECGYPAIFENEIGGGFCVHGKFYFAGVFGCSHGWRSRVTSGMTTQARSTTTQILKTALRRTKGQSRMSRPMV